MRNLAAAVFLPCFLACVLAAACAPRPQGSGGSPVPVRQYAKGMVDQTAICQLYVDGWDELTAKERVYAWYLAKASWAGRDVFYDQMHARALDVRSLLEAIVSKPQKVDPAALERIRLHLRRIWVDGSLHDGHTGLKIKPTYSREELLAAAKAAGIAEPEARVASLAALLFDPEVDPLLTARAPMGKKDIVQSSAVNFYRGVSRKDVESLGAKFAPNSTVVKEDGKVVELPWRTQSPGLYAKELEASIGWLEKARAIAPSPEEAKVLEELIAWYRTGAYESFHAHSVAWLKADPKIETIQGFIESYDDPLGVKASYQGYAFGPAEATSARMRALAGLVLHLEQNAPWKPEYKKDKIDPPVAKAVQLLFWAGDGGKTLPVGINLPNPQDIREKFGSKSLYLANVAACADAVSTKTTVAEFVLPEDRAQIARWSAKGYEAHVSLHEVAGHASGKVSPKLTGDPATYLKENYSALEEARAELVAIWSYGDAKLIEAGVIESKETRDAMQKHFIMGAFSQLRRAPEGETFGQDHLRARWLILNFTKEKGAVEMPVVGGKTYTRIPDAEKFHAAIGELLAEVMRIKAEGDYAAGKALLEKYGLRFDPALRDEVVARAKSAGVPTAFAFQPPRLVPVKNAAGEVTDVKLSYEESFDDYQLRLSRGED